MWKLVEVGEFHTDKYRTNHYPRLYIYEENRKILFMPRWKSSWEVHRNRVNKIVEEHNKYVNRKRISIVRDYLKACCQLDELDGNNDD